MKYAYINGKILDGTKDMQVKEGFVILTDNDKNEDIVKAGGSGYGCGVTGRD